MPSIPLMLAIAIPAALFGFTAWQSARISAQFPPQGEFVALAGGRIHLTQRQAQGHPRGTIVLIHGASGNQADMMLPLGDRLAAKGFRVIAVDRPGLGWSDRPDGRADASPARQAIVIREALGKIGVEHAIVVTHSLAGALGTNFALDQSDFTDGLVLVAPVTHPWPGGVAWYYHVAATPVVDQLFTRLLSLPVGFASLQGGIDHVFAPQPAPADFLNATGVPLVLRPASFMANSEDVDVLEAFVTAQAPRLKDIRLPVAIVTGDQDRVVLTHIHSYGSAREIPGATLKVLPGVGHSPHWADPEAVVAVIEGVAERVEAGKSAALAK